MKQLPGVLVHYIWKVNVDSPTLCTLSIEATLGLPHGVCALGEGGAGGVDEPLRLAVVGDEFVYEGQSGDREYAHQHGRHSSVLFVL